jgi:regulation of enolase protein 1 (concanavalin A-like superfamily)
MKMHQSLWLGLGMLIAAQVASAGELVFEDDFKGLLKEGWTWRREHREGWRVGAKGLEVRVQPGNMWGGANNARNVLVREVPDPALAEVEISVLVENRPTEQYEQANLVWYYDDSTMVKLGQELVDGQLSIVMGREENDRTRTIAIIPLDVLAVHLRFIVSGREIRGEFRSPNWPDWREAGRCDLPGPKEAHPKVSLQFYQGPPNAEHWARVGQFQIRKRAAK